ncbi:hypothetical protein FOA52_001961 [Chlamydomonas sp. UWO 241]|nr:hypothetical protein FOA52_001961 [Chlamydomonas sp. UWO 241]
MRSSCGGGEHGGEMASSFAHSVGHALYNPAPASVLPLVRELGSFRLFSPAQFLHHLARASPSPYLLHRLLSLSASLCPCPPWTLAELVGALGGSAVCARAMAALWALSRNSSGSGGRRGSSDGRAGAVHGSPTGLRCDSVRGPDSGGSDLLPAADTFAVLVSELVLDAGSSVGDARGGCTDAAASAGVAPEQRAAAAGEHEGAAAGAPSGGGVGASGAAPAAGRASRAVLECLMALCWAESAPADDDGAYLAGGCTTSGLSTPEEGGAAGGTPALALYSDVLEAASTGAGCLDRGATVAWLLQHLEGVFGGGGSARAVAERRRGSRHAGTAAAATDAPTNADCDVVPDSPVDLCSPPASPSASGCREEQHAQRPPCVGSHDVDDAVAVAAACAPPPPEQLAGVAAVAAMHAVQALGVPLLVGVCWEWLQQRHHEESGQGSEGRDQGHTSPPCVLLLSAVSRIGGVAESAVWQQLARATRTALQALRQEEVEGQGAGGGRGGTVVPLVSVLRAALAVVAGGVGEDGGEVGEEEAASGVARQAARWEACVVQELRDALPTARQQQQQQQQQHGHHGQPPQQAVEQVQARQLRVVAGVVAALRPLLACPAPLPALLPLHRLLLELSDTGRRQRQLEQRQQNSHLQMQHQRGGGGAGAGAAAVVWDDVDEVVAIVKACCFDLQQQAQQQQQQQRRRRRSGGGERGAPASSSAAVRHQSHSPAVHAYLEQLLRAYETRRDDAIRAISSFAQKEPFLRDAKPLLLSPSIAVLDPGQAYRRYRYARALTSTGLVSNTELVHFASACTALGVPVDDPTAAAAAARTGGTGAPVASTLEQLLNKLAELWSAPDHVAAAVADVADAELAACLTGTGACADPAQVVELALRAAFSAAARARAAAAAALRAAPAGAPAAHEVARAPLEAAAAWHARLVRLLHGHAALHMPLLSRLRDLLCKGQAAGLAPEDVAAAAGLMVCACGLAGPTARAAERMVTPQVVASRSAAAAPTVPGPAVMEWLVAQLPRSSIRALCDSAAVECALVQQALSFPVVVLGRARGWGSDHGQVPPLLNNSPATRGGGYAPAGGGGAPAAAYLPLRLLHGLQWLSARLACEAGEGGQAQQQQQQQQQGSVRTSGDSGAGGGPDAGVCAGGPTPKTAATAAGGGDTPATATCPPHVVARATQLCAACLAPGGPVDRALLLPLRGARAGVPALAAHERAALAAGLPLPAAALDAAAAMVAETLLLQQQLGGPKRKRTRGGGGGGNGGGPTRGGHGEAEGAVTRTVMT